MRLDVKIQERSTERKVSAIVRPATVSDKVLWTRWHGHMPRDAEDAHWEWDELIDLALALPERFALYALEAQGELQGLRLLEVSEDDVEKYGIHALRLSTAPWNRPPLEKYRGVGSVLVGVAILRSEEDGHKGHVHCESLPAAEEFHQANGMVRFNGQSPEGLHRFRFDENAAEEFLRQLTSEGLYRWPI